MPTEPEKIYLGFRKPDHLDDFDQEGFNQNFILLIKKKKDRKKEKISIKMLILLFLVVF